MLRAEFDNLLIGNADEPRVRKHRKEALHGVRRILQQLPADGNLGAWGDKDDIRTVLFKRVETDGVSFGPLTMLIIGALINALIAWWFRDKSVASLAIASLKE